MLTGDCAPSYGVAASVAACRSVSMFLVETTPDHGEQWWASKNAFREVNTPSDTPLPPLRQAFINACFHQPSATEALLAELAFPAVADWRTRS
ncbi:hypothetical protein ACLBX9_07130 [Methylobacterium sp. A49B]